MRLDELLDGIDALDLSNVYPDMEVVAVTSDSRQVAPGSVFVAIPGTRADGHQFIDAALNAGATVVVQSRPIPPEAVGSFVRVADTRAVYAELCARLSGRPSRRLRVIGVTGTNGKTTTVLLIRHLLNAGGRRAAALGTLGLLRPGSSDFEQRGLTTPDAWQLQQAMRALADDGATHLVMEVSSHALVQERVAGVEFAGGVFTNLTQDHFDYHGTAEAYREAKALLFTRHLAMSGGYAVINGDDATGRELIGRFQGITVVYGTAPDFNLILKDVESTPAGLSWDLVIKNGVWPEVLERHVNVGRMHSPLAGGFNAYNCAAAIAVALLEGLSLDEIERALPDFGSVPGRLERVPNERGVHVYVDYAHTPDALRNVLTALDGLRPPGGRIITVFGCGGDRDREKRPLMATAAQQGSDMVIVTSDNPRSEVPEAIVDEMWSGISADGCPARREVDRRRAIRLALGEARRGDVVLIAGKGHEDYQILGDRTIHFSDVEEVQAYLANRASAKSE